MTKLNREFIPKPFVKGSFSLPKIEEFETSNSYKIIFIHKKNLPIIPI